MHAKKLWSLLPPAQKDQLIKELIEFKVSEGWPRGLADALARAINFRPSTLRGAEPARLHRLLLRAIGRLPGQGLFQFLFEFHRLCRPDLFRDLLTAIQVPHDEKLVPAPAEPEFDQSTATKDLEAIVGAHPRDNALFGLRLLTLWVDPDRGAIIDTLLGRFSSAFDQDGAETSSPDQQEPTDALRLDSDPHLEKGPFFSNFDKVIIRSIVSALNEVEGSLDFDSLDDLVQEVIELNDSRAQSYFHRGFLDALLGRELRPYDRGANRERRAWYVVGYVEGGMRQQDQDDVVRSVLGLGTSDRATLLETGGTPAGVHFAPLIIPRLLDHAETDEALAWLKVYLVDCANSLLDTILSWARRALVQDDPSDVRRVLELIDRRLPQILAHHGELPLQLERDLKRRLAVAWRREGRIAQARKIVEELLEDCPEGVEKSRLIGDRALMEVGVSNLEQLALPPKQTREAFLAGIERARPLLEEGATVASPSAVVLLMLALPAVAEPTASDEEREEAIDFLRRSIDAMVEDESGFWEVTGILPRSRFYLAVLELRLLDPGRAQTAVTRLKSLLCNEGRFPIDLVQDAISNAVLQDAPDTAKLAVLALELHRQEMLGSLDIETLGSRSSPFRKAVAESLDSGAESLTTAEQWSGWQQLLGGALAASPRDIEMARQALDWLERLAQEQSQTRRMLLLLEEPSRIDPAWDSRECDEARARLFERVGEMTEARSALLALTHRAISDGDSDPPDLIDKLRVMGVEAEELRNLECRVEATLQASVVDEPVREPGTDDRAASIVFVGCDDVHTEFRDTVVDAIQSDHPKSQIRFILPGWGSSWARVLKGMENRLGSADAIVLTRFVRTHLGRTVRRIADEKEIPWVACTGQGRASIERSIRQAIAVVNR